jgi:TPR repeat protein
MSGFATEYKEIFERALAHSCKSRREGLLGLEDELDEEKEKIRDVYEWGLRLAVDGTDSAIIDKILTNLINQETDKDKITLGKIKKDAILAIRDGWPHYLIAQLINSHVNIEVEETLKKYGMEGERRYKNPSLEEIVCKKCKQTNFMFPDTSGACIYCGNKLKNPPEEEAPLTEQDIRFNKAYELYSAKQYAQARPQIEALANEGYAAAQSLLGNYYHFGREDGEDWGVDRDRKKAFELYRKAADQGDPRGINNLGSEYMDGESVEKDTAKGLELYRKAAEKGYSQAQYNLATCYYLGEVTEKDIDKSALWFRRASYLGHPAAQCFYGMMLYYGEGVYQDCEEAVKWFQKSADQDNESSMYMLGESYTYAYGVEQDLTKAFDFYSKAVSAGNTIAQSALGTCFFYGLGTKQDYAKAVECFQKAKQETNEAQYYLGICYYFGLGVKEDRQQAKTLIEQLAGDYADAAEFLKGSYLFPMLISNYLRSFCHGYGWYVYQRLSIKGLLFPLILIGNKKIIVTYEKQDIAPLVDALAALKDSLKVKEAEIIPAFLTVKELPVDITKISGECKKNNINIYDTGSFMDFIRQLGTQNEIDESGEERPPFIDELTESVTAIVDAEDE